jgi:hypothetical protein
MKYSECLNQLCDYDFLGSNQILEAKYLTN